MPWNDVISDVVDAEGRSLVDEKGTSFAVATASYFTPDEVARIELSGTDNRLLDQYRESLLLKSLLKAILDNRFSSIRAAVDELKYRLDIDRMVGTQLDGLGKILGFARPQVLDFAESGDAFEFAGSMPGSPWVMGDGQWDDSLPWDDAEPWVDTPQSVPEKGFSSLQSSDQGGRFVGLTTNALMSDSDYRVLLRAAIFRNTTAATVPDLEEYGTAVLGVPVRVVNGTPNISIEIVGSISPVLRGVIQKTLQAAAGIRIDNFTYGVAVDAFQFDGGSGTGFGSVSSPQTGSGFARLLQS